MKRKVLSLALICICVICILVGCGSENGDRYIKNVKDGYLDAYPNITVGKAFDDFFENAIWSYEVDKDDKNDGEYLVQFTGECLVLEEDSKVTLFFIVNSEGEFYLDGGYIEGSPEGITPEMVVYAAFEGNRDVTENTAETVNINTDLTYDLNTDIENAMLHSDGNGHIVDDYGNIIPEYSYIEITENGSLYDVESDCIMEGYEVSPNGQISRYMVMDDYSETSTGNSLTEIIGLRSGEYKNPKSPVVITIPDEVYSTEATEIFVYVPIYIGTEDNKYEYEYSGMINLFDIGSITIMTGIQESTCVEYDLEEGYIGNVSNLIGDSLGYDYDVEGATKFYLDGFEPESLYFIGKSGTYVCNSVNGYEGQVEITHMNSEEVEFTISCLTPDNSYFTYGGFSEIVDKDTVVFKTWDSVTTLEWISEGTIKLTQNGEFFGLSEEESEIIESIIGQTFEFVSSEYVGW